MTTWNELSDELEKELSEIGESDGSVTEENLIRVRARNQAHVRFGEKVKEANVQTKTIFDKRK